MSFIEDFLRKRNIPFETTPEGVAYRLQTPGEGNTPQEGDFVAVHYLGSLMDGTKFDSSYDRKQPIRFEMGAGQLIPGFEIAAKTLRPGGKGVFYLPPEQAYGARGAGDVIPPNAHLIFEVELLEIMDKATFEAEKKAHEKAQKEAMEAYIAEQMKTDLKVIQEYLQPKGQDYQMTANGLHYRIIEQGTGPKAEAGKDVSVHYTGRLLNGTEFDSSHKRNQPFSFTLGAGRVIQGWDEGLALFHEGGKGTLVIPSVLAYGPRDMGTIPANSVLEFDIELVKVS